MKFNPLPAGALFICITLAMSAPAAAPPATASFDEMVNSGRDVWGEAAMAQPNGASYEFFEHLLPPPRYVNADFRHYPIVLSAPNARTKARLISNGSGVNLRGGARSWNDNGAPVTFRVGPDEFLFGALRERLSEPTLAEGFLPIVEIRYMHPTPFQSGGNIPLAQSRNQPTPEIYRLESFAGTDAALAEHAVVFAKFSLAQGTNGVVAVQVDSRAPLRFESGRLVDADGAVLAYFDNRWRWERQRAVARLNANQVATLAIPTRPLPDSSEFSFTANSYATNRDACAQTWRGVLEEGMNVEVPEARVNDAWRHLLIQNFQLLNGDRIHYSAGNQYDKLYEAEGSDAALAMMSWGYEADMRRMIPPLLDFTRKGLEYHQAGHKIDDICRYYWQTRDAAFVQAMRPRWEAEVTRILAGRTNEHGLFPKEQYCGDISTSVYSLNSNAKCWAALRDISAVLRDLGERDNARELAEAAAGFRKNILAALDKSIRRETDPPFIPIALLFDEGLHDPITATRIGSYWNLMANYVIGTGLFGTGSEQEQWLPRYIETRGGLCMGMTRAGGGEFTFWTGGHRINPLYGTRYALDTLRRDDPERALVSFYGMLAQGFTRNTFISGEGCTLAPVDDGGRLFYCPPNSAANAHFLSMLRHLLVQDWDTNDDGEPETLRLLFATPKRWLEDGKRIKVERAPTAFGPVSFNVHSKLSRDEVLAEVDLPHRNRPTTTLLRIRVPDGWTVVSAQAGATPLKVDERGTVDISSLNGKVTIMFHTKRT
jgi:hypothetical protein